MSKLSTKDIKTGGGISKIFTPGVVKCKINGLTLEDFKWKEGAKNLILHLEGPDLGTDFQGFAIDKEDPSKGVHKGQIGSVKASQWAFADGETKSGIAISRDTDILKFIKQLCVAFKKVSWLDAQDDKHDTIESLIAAFNKDMPFGTASISFCIAGKEYVNKGGYPAYDLFLPKFSKTGAPFGDKVCAFNEDEHIIKKKVEAVSEFDSSPDVSAPSNDEFTID